MTAFTEEQLALLKSPWQRKIELAVHVDPTTGCWNWGRGKDKQGYPRFRQGKTVLYAHKAAAWIWNGVPMDLEVGVHVQRTCGNLSCVCPAHLSVVDTRVK